MKKKLQMHTQSITIKRKKLATAQCTTPPIKSVDLSFGLSKNRKLLDAQMAMKIEEFKSVTVLYIHGESREMDVIKRFLLF